MYFLLFKFVDTRTGYTKIWHKILNLYLNKISSNIAKQFGSENCLTYRVLKFTIRWREMAGFNVTLAPPTCTLGNGTRFPQLRKLAGTWDDGNGKNSWEPEQCERIHRLADASCCWRRNELTESITLFALPWEFLPTENGEYIAKRESLEICLFLLQIGLLCYWCM